MVRLSCACAAACLLAGCGDATTRTSNCSPVPRVSARRADEPHTIVVRWSVAVPAGACGPSRLLISARSAVDQGPAIWAEGGVRELRQDAGIAVIHLRVVDNPPYQVTASVFTRRGRGETRPIPVAGEHVPLARQRATRRRVERCRAVADVRKVCPATTTPLLHERATRPLHGIAPAELAASARRSLAGSAGADIAITTVACTASGVCDVSFTTNYGRYGAGTRFWLRSTGPERSRCYRMVRWAVTRPSNAPYAANAAIPFIANRCLG